MLDRIIFLIILFLVWVTFSGFLEPFFLISGAVSCAIVYFVASRMDSVEKSFPVHILPRLPLYLIWLYREVIKSSIDVAIRVWRVDPDISPLIKWVNASQRNELGKTIYANSITLTPGTVCIDVKDNKLEVHALTQGAMEELETGKMNKKIATKVTG